MPRKTLTIFGILLVIIQIIGVPHLWQTAFGIFIGIYLIIVALRGSRNDETDLEFENKSEAGLVSGSDLKENATSYDSKEIDKGN